MYSQISILRHHIYKAVDFGANFRELCRRLDITPELLADGEGHLPYVPGKEKDFWTHAVELTQNPKLGLQMGQQSDKYNPFGMLGMLATSCRTVGEGMAAVSRFNDTLTGIFRFSLDLSGKEAVFELTPHSLWEESNPDSARQAVDMSIAAWLCSINEYAIRQVVPVRTEIKAGRSFEDEYFNVLKGPVFFGMPANRMIFNKEDLDTELVNYDQSLRTSFEFLLREKQKQLDSRKSVSGQIRSLLLSKFNGQIAHIDIVSSSLFMTTRTLQRKLAEEKTSYRTICNEIRRELADGLLKAGNKNKTQIAHLLGYSDSSSLSKAFRNWENATARRRALRSR